MQPEEGGHAERQAADERQEEKADQGAGSEHEGVTAKCPGCAHDTMRLFLTRRSAEKLQEWGSFVGV